MVTMANGIARERVRTTATAKAKAEATIESRKLIGWQSRTLGLQD